MSRIPPRRQAWTKLATLLIALLVMLGAALASAAEPAAVRRFALLVGANDGGSERELLRYAASDAELLGKTLVELGGVEPNERVSLVDPSVTELEHGFRTIAAKVERARQDGARVEFFFYYSGHSDETGLLLGGVHLDYKRLRGLIDQVGADLRIGVLDSCSSGAFTRFKGGKKRAPFVLGSAAAVQGHAYLTSSSADEAAQESDRIGGSFFTHFLVTGLRGAADFDGDRQVTLDEAYRFAYDETLARTETTAGGPQHAAYDIALAGTGELVVTDLRKTSARLEIAGDVAGRLYIRDRRGKLAAELFKPKQAGTVTLALEPGKYTVTIDDGHELHRAQVEVRSSKTAVLKFEQLEGIALEGTRLRGDPRADRPSPPPGGYTRVPFNIGVAPGAELNTNFGRTGIINRFSASLGVTRAAGVDGAQLALGVAWTTDYLRGVQAAVGGSISEHDARGLQTAIGASWTKGHLRGVQLGLVISSARRLSGVQIAALNLADEAKGLQLGAVNVSRGEVAGVQIGLVNYAEEADVSIGLIPVTKAGGVWVDAWTSDVQLVHAGLKLRARRSYTLLTGGIHPIGDEASRSWSAGIGLGGPLVWRRRVSLELDNVLAVVNPGLAVTRAPLMLDTLRLTVAYRPARRFAIWAALTGNALLDFDKQSDGEHRPGYGWATRVSSPS
ncbi:MAG: caspase family protein, partial [Enhygromyxa sp.]